MKSLVFTLALFASFSSFAVVMGDDAAEMFSVMSHPQVVDCMKQNAPGKLVNVEVEKLVARCPGCNTYIVTGHLLRLDNPDVAKTVVTIQGKGFIGTSTMGGFVQTYTCSVAKKK